VPTDADVQESIRNTFRWSPEIIPSQISVTVAGGRATLEGTVDSLWKKGHAEALAAHVYGVRIIENKLSVVRTMEVTDKVIAETIRTALDRRLPYHSNDITVSVEDGYVTLTGTVPSWQEHRDAAFVAEHTEGVLNVSNLVTVHRPPSMEQYAAATRA
jgi:osmotically-inducible protein OsmY